MYSSESTAPSSEEDIVMKKKVLQLVTVPNNYKEFHQPTWVK